MATESVSREVFGGMPGYGRGDSASKSGIRGQNDLAALSCSSWLPHEGSGRAKAGLACRPQRLTARASTASTPAGEQISGLMSKAARCSPRSVTRAEKRDDGGDDRVEVARRLAADARRGSRRTAGRRSSAAAACRVSGGSATERSARYSARTPPAPTTMSGPRAGSRAMPRMSSGPGPAISVTVTRGPRRAARSCVGGGEGGRARRGRGGRRPRRTCGRCRACRS